MPDPESEEAMSVIDEIAAERRRQLEEEGWTLEHDNTLVRGELARAASAYAGHAARFHNVRGIKYQTKPMHPGWPWDKELWRPKDPRRDLVRAAALIVAEIERLDRAASQPPKPRPRGERGGKRPARPT
jgi:hypothetical protein